MLDTKPTDAGRALSYSRNGRKLIKTRNGGNKLKHKPSCYGIAIKWLIYVKGMTYEQFAKKYNGKTAQNLNHFINRTPKSNYIEEDLQKIATTLGVTYEYFATLCNDIEILMKEKNG